MVRTTDCLRLGAVVSAAVFNVGPAFAQATDRTTDRTAIEEVVVTAERRAEPLQEVPISMSALNGSMLQDQGFKDFDEYSTLIPNLAIGANGKQGVSERRSIAIRGVSGAATTAVYLNDTPIPLSTDPRAMDLEQVEVLRGPQGTLFGQASMGGIVRYVTKQPSSKKNSGMIEAEGSNTERGGGGYSVDGRLNLVLAPDVIGLRVTAYSEFEPGVFTRRWGKPLDPRIPSLPYLPGTPMGEKSHVAGEQKSGATAALEITPSSVSGLSISPLFMYERSSGNGYPLANSYPGNFVQAQPFNVSERVSDNWSFAGITVKQDWGFGRLVATGSYFSRYANDTEDGTQANAVLYLGLPYYVAAPIQTNQPTMTSTGEIRYESNLSGPVQFTAGLFYLQSKTHYRQHWNVPGLSTATGGALNDLEYFIDARSENRERAGFVDLTYQATEKLRLSAGIRRAALRNSTGGPQGGSLIGGPSLVPQNPHREYKTSPRYTAKYQFTPDHMIYASAANGYRIGGASGPLPDFCGPALRKLGLVGLTPPAVHSDSLWSYEVGLKDSWLDDRIQSRVSAYRIEWSDIQQSITLNFEGVQSCGFGIGINAGRAVINGGEAEIDLAPLPRLTVNLSVGYEDAKITDPGVTISQFSAGTPIAGVPEWTGSVIGQYIIPMGDYSTFVRGTWSYTGARRSYTNVAPPTGTVLNSYSTTNLRVGLDSGPWEATLFASNLFNKIGTTGDVFLQTSIVPNQPRLFVTRPRTIGVQVRRNFD